MSWRHAMGCAVHLGIGEERLRDDLGKQPDFRCGPVPLLRPGVCR